MMNNNTESYDLIPCISCNKCMPVCPVNIGIPGSFAAMNHFVKSGDIDSSLEMEKTLVTTPGYKRAGKCIVCGRCEKHCPMNIKIRDRLLEISKLLK